MLNKDRFRALRIERGFTHEQLAELLNVGVAAIWRYESGKNDPAGHVLARIANVFQVSTDYLLSLTDDPTPSLSQGNLNQEEREAIAAWRRGDRAEAAKIILNG